MRLESLSITRGYFGDKPLRAQIKFKGENGSTELDLDESATQRVLAVVADLVVEAGKECAARLTREVIEQAAAPLKTISRERGQ